MKKIVGLLLMCCASAAQAQTDKYPVPPPMTHEMTEFWTPRSPVIQKGKTVSGEFVSAPSDALVLFDGKDLSQWEKAPDKNVLVKGKDMSKFKSSAKAASVWTVKDGMLTVNKEAGDIQTKQSFGDFQLHIEWRIPEGIKGEGQLRGNSGVFLQGMYEIQILDSYNNETYANGQAGSVYKQTAPLTNVTSQPGEWNVYDIIYTAPTFKSDGTYRSNPRVTLLHNGVIVQNNTLILGTTPYIGLPQVVKHDRGPIRLQAHGDDSAPISFRNIWIREL